MYLKVTCKLGKRVFMYKVCFRYISMIVYFRTSYMQQRMQWLVSSKPWMLWSRQHHPLNMNYKLTLTVQVICTNRIIWLISRLISSIYFVQSATQYINLLGNKYMCIHVQCNPSSSASSRTDQTWLLQRGGYCSEGI